MEVEKNMNKDLIKTYIELAGATTALYAGIAGIGWSLRILLGVA